MVSTAKTGFFRSGEDHPQFGMLQRYAEAFHLPQDRNAHKASGQIVVCPVHHPLRVIGAAHKQKKRQEYQAPERRGLHPGSRAAEPADPQKQIKQHPDHGGSARDLKHDPAEMIIEGKFPGGVHMPVQKDPLSDFPRTGAESRYVQAFLLRKQGIDHLLVQDELKEEQEQGGSAENQTEPGAEKVGDRAQTVQDRGEHEIAVESGRVFREAFHPDIPAAARIPQELCHIFPGFPFSGASRRTLRHLPAYVGDLPDHKGNRVRAAFLKPCHSCHRRSPFSPLAEMIIQVFSEYSTKNRFRSETGAWDMPFPRSAGNK